MRELTGRTSRETSEPPPPPPPSLNPQRSAGPTDRSALTDDGRAEQDEQRAERVGEHPRFVRVHAAEIPSPPCVDVNE